MRLIPNSGDSRLTGGASACVQPVLPDAETMALDEEGVAVWTIGILPAAHMTREISGIYVAKAGRSTDFASTN